MKGIFVISGFDLAVALFGFGVLYYHSQEILY